jgi:hypothetical protein
VKAAGAGPARSPSRSNLVINIGNTGEQPVANRPERPNRQQMLAISASRFLPLASVWLTKWESFALKSFSAKRRLPSVAFET